MQKADVVIVGAGAAGLMAAIWAGRANPKRRIVLLDGAKKIGRKILIAGGGRCNVTHFEVTEQAYAGASRNAIKKVLKHFDVPETTAFFAELGVKLKREETGKLFPTTDKASTVLNALVQET
ncbi:MAG: NAD(P)/FAD-dependent oxidoreductase, partial [Chloroflexota bacterium]